MAKTTVKRIHKEFDDAGDRLIAAANAIVNKGILADAARAQKLIDLGFTQCKEALRYGTLKKIKEDGDLAESYRVKYPQYKFITKQMVDKICKRHNLLFGGVERYKGTIPTKNIVEILSFNVKEEDLNEERGLWSSAFRFTTLDYMGLWGHGETETQKQERLAKEKAEKEKANQKQYDKKLSICATRNVMDLKNAKIEGYEIKEIVKDPIVLHPVKGGFLIISKWGDEASDEALVNETMN